MNLETQKKSLYVTLDSILDVKADIVLKGLDGKPMAAVRDLMHKYVTRKTDYFHTKEHGDALRKTFDNRSAPELNNGSETGIVDILYNTVSYVANYYKGLGYPYRTTLYINTHPYALNEKDTETVMVAFLNSREWDGLDVRMVHEKKEAITPTWLKLRKISEMWDVEGLEWLNLQADIGNWKESTFMPSLFLHVPGVLSEFTNNVDMEYSKIDKESKLDIWDSYTLLVTGLCKLNFLPAIDFTSRELVKVFIQPQNQG